MKLTRGNELEGATRYLYIVEEIKLHACMHENLLVPVRTWILEATEEYRTIDGLVLA